MSDVGFKKKCKVIDFNNPTQYTVAQISGIRCLHNVLRVGLTFKLSLWTACEMKMRCFFPGVILTIPDYPIITLSRSCLTHNYFLLWLRAFPSFCPLVLAFLFFYPDGSGCRGPLTVAGLKSIRGGTSVDHT